MGVAAEHRFLFLILSAQSFHLSHQSCIGCITGNRQRAGSRTLSLMQIGRGERPLVDDFPVLNYLQHRLLACTKGNGIVLVVC
jgi:hypothetical protein